MGLPHANNDLKVLFLIVNSITGLLAGLLSFSLGVGLGVVDGLRQFYGVVFGLIGVGWIILGVAALGYAGAILHNRVMLVIYSGIMVLAVVLDVVGMVNTDLSGSGTTSSISNPISSIFSLASLITHLCLSVLAVILAMVLAIGAHKHTDQGMILSPLPAQYNTVP